MEAKTVSITREEYEKFQRLKRVDTELLHDIAKGIKDILQGKIKEV